MHARDGSGDVWTLKGYWLRLERKIKSMDTNLRDFVMKLFDEAKGHWQHGRIDAARRLYEEGVNLWEENNQDQAFTPYIAAIERLGKIYQSKLAELLAVK